MLACSGASFAQNPPPTVPAAAPAAAEHKEHKEHKEHHPELHKAMHKLRGAKADLEKAAHDYNGHKAKAIEAIDQALLELKAALESDQP